MKVDKDLIVPGNLKCGSITLPADSVGNDAITPSDPIDCDNQLHQNRMKFDQKYGIAAISERRSIYMARSDGTIDSFRAFLSVANVGAATVTVDLYKNGSTVLSSVITLNNGHAAYHIVEATFATATYVADDAFEIVITATAGGGTLGQGLLVDLCVREQP